MKTKLLAFSLFAATIGAVLAYPHHRGGTDPTPAAPVASANKPKVEAVFVLDTTGSMSGLIQAAKENIWSIARSMASAKPTPEIKIGLVAFRDRGDQYVTQVVNLSSDLDTTYATLMDFRAEGGGDGPESVNQALHDAVHKIGWSQDPNAYKVIFLVGDAPPHMDYQDDVKYPETLKTAAAKGIIVNTIQAGADSTTQEQWRHIASLSQGQYFQVGQSGDALAVATPYDEKLAGLSKELDDTRLFYGDEAKRRELAVKQAATGKLNAEASAASRAKRAIFNASAPGEKNFAGENELVEDVASGRVKLDAVAPASLPEPVQALSKDEQERLIKETAKKRAELRDQIQTLGAQRRDYITGKLKESKTETSSLDYQIFNTVKAQAAKKGLRYEAAPSY
jgi:Mg-chelatase subunit ChlD